MPPKFAPYNDITKALNGTLTNVKPLKDSNNFLEWRDNVRTAFSEVCIDDDGDLTLFDVLSKPEAEVTEIFNEIYETISPFDPEGGVEQEAHNEARANKSTRHYAKINKFLSDKLKRVMENHICLTMKEEIMIVGADGDERVIRRPMSESIEGKAIWTKVHEQFRMATTATARQNEKAKLELMKQKDKETVSEFATRFVKQVGQVERTGGTVEPDDQRRWFLRGIRSDLETSATALIGRDFVSIFDDAARLQPAEQLLIDRKVTHGRNAGARDNHGQSPTQKCTFCKKLGHPKKKCYKFKKWKRNKDKSKNGNDEDKEEDGDDKEKPKIGRGTNQFDKARNGFTRGVTTTARNGMCRSILVQNIDSDNESDLPDLVDDSDSDDSDDSDSESDIPELIDSDCERDDSDDECRDDGSDDDCSNNESSNATAPRIAVESKSGDDTMIGKAAMGKSVVSSSIDEDGYESDTCIFDSGCEYNIVKSAECASNIRTADTTLQLIMADGTPSETMITNQQCDFVMNAWDEDGHLQLIKIPGPSWYCPSAYANTVAPTSLHRNGFSVEGNNGIEIWSSPDGDRFVVELMEDNLFVVNGNLMLREDETARCMKSKFTPTTNSMSRWHDRLHISNDALLKLQALHNGINIDQPSLKANTVNCKGCNEAKGTRPYSAKPQSDTDIPEPGVVVGFDLDILSHKSKEGYVASCTSVDHGSGYACNVHVKSKEAGTAMSAVDSVVREAELLFGRKYDEIRVDKGGEFDNKLLESYCYKHKIRLIKCKAGEENHVATKVEPVVKAIQESAGAFLHHATRRLSEWPYAYTHARRLYNLGESNNQVGRSRYEVHHQKVADLSHLRVLFSICWFSPPKKPLKLMPKKRRGVYLGCTDDHYRDYLVRDINTGYILEIPRVTTDETQFIKSTARVQELVYSSDDEDIMTPIAGRVVGGGDGSTSLDPSNPVEVVVVDEGTINVNELDATVVNIENSPTVEEALTVEEAHEELPTEVDEEHIEVNSNFENRYELRKNRKPSRVQRELQDQAIEDMLIDDDDPNIIYLHKAFRMVRSQCYDSNLCEDSPYLMAATEYARLMSVTPTFIPTKVQHIFSSDISNDVRIQWIDSYMHEADGIVLEQALKPVLVPHDRKLVKQGIMFKVKRDENGLDERMKTRIFAKGYSQKFAENFHESSSPTADRSAVKLFFAIAAQFGHHPLHLDAPNAFFHGEKIDHDDVFMEIPDGFEEYVYAESPRPDPKIEANRRQLRDEFEAIKKSKSAKLKIAMQCVKGIPGLKQSSVAWYDKVADDLEEYGYTRSVIEPCLFYRRDVNTGEMAIILVYVDDFGVTGNEAECERAAAILMKLYGCKKSLMKHFLGSKVVMEGKKITISQSTLVDDLLKRTNMEDCNHESTPMRKDVTLSKSQCPADGEEGINFPYHPVCGVLLYLADWTRPDIYMGVTQLCRFAANPGKPHLNAMKYLIRYLAGTRNVGISFDGDAIVGDLCGFVDAEFCTLDLETRRSFGGFVLFMAGGPIMTKIDQQARAAGSTAVAEYYALSRCGEGLLFILNLLKEIGFEITSAVPVFEDNQTAFNMANMSCKVKHTKHIELRYHLVREMVFRGEINVVKISGKHQVADILTKPQPRDLFGKMSKAIRGNLNEVLKEMSNEEFSKFANAFGED